MHVVPVGVFWVVVGRFLTGPGQNSPLNKQTNKPNTFVFRLIFTWTQLLSKSLYLHAFDSDVPAVEKLQLSDLGVCEDEVDDTDVRHFQELRQRMVQMERADLEEGDRRAGILVLPTIRCHGFNQRDMNKYK